MGIDLSFSRNLPCLLHPHPRQILSSASTTIVRTFLCETFEELGNTSYLKADYSISCDTVEYRAYRAYALLMIVVSDLDAYDKMRPRSGAIVLRGVLRACYAAATCEIWRSGWKVLIYRLSCICDVCIFV